jgi:uncharacterized membrane protein (UPF0127 family)
MWGGTNNHEYVVFNLDRGLHLAHRVSLAATSAARRKGLLGIESLPSGAGLWIFPCEAIHTFGMRMAIDAIFLDRGFCVTKLRPSLPPWRVAICLSADSVLELQAGTVAYTHTVVGDRLSFAHVAGSENQIVSPDKSEAQCL